MSNMLQEIVDRIYGEGAYQKVADDVGREFCRCYGEQRDYIADAFGILGLPASPERVKETRINKAIKGLIMRASSEAEKDYFKRQELSYESEELVRRLGLVSQISREEVDSLWKEYNWSNHDSKTLTLPDGVLRNSIIFKRHMPRQFRNLLEVWRNKWRGEGIPFDVFVCSRLCGTGKKPSVNVIETERFNELVDKGRLGFEDFKDLKGKVFSYFSILYCQQRDIIDELERLDKQGEAISIQLQRVLKAAVPSLSYITGGYDLNDKVTLDKSSLRFCESLNDVKREAGQFVARALSTCDCGQMRFGGTVSAFEYVFGRMEGEHSILEIVRYLLETDRLRVNCLPQILHVDRFIVFGDTFNVERSLRNFVEQPLQNVDYEKNELLKVDYEFVNQVNKKNLPEESLLRAFVLIGYYYTRRDAFLHTYDGEPGKFQEALLEDAKSASKMSWIRVSESLKDGSPELYY